ncbi:hypothetical protein ACVR05_03875 [Streptococcus caprae]|uniref:Uncharacterized protein n=1 Tax=Streptococcus caprae TaxID=1640501 RepID=A0ABV8CYM6_9STRE
MNYELCLEYGSYPLKPIDALLDQRKTAPFFLKEDTALLEKIEEMNTLFHELFLTIECQFHYIGPQFPEKIERLRGLYADVAQDIKDKYADQEAIKIEPFIL